jgi:hypothetical protein
VNCSRGKRGGYKENRKVRQAESESIRDGVRKVVGPTLQGMIMKAAETILWLYTAIVAC